MTKTKTANEVPAGSGAIDALLADPLRVVNIGLEQFATDLAAQGVDVVDIDWSPPAAGNKKLGSLLAKLGS